MALEYRGCRVYCYTSRRVGSRVRRVYRGSGVCAEFAAQLAELERAERQLAATDRRIKLDALRNENAQFRCWLARTDNVITAALTRAGWHRVRRQWRKQRGATVSAISKVGELSWVPSELSAQAGTLPAGTIEKAEKQDKGALKAIDQFLDNPAARAIWGDIGRHVLMQWVRRYGGKNQLMKEALVRFASDLRSQLAGENPNALDVLLAERVVMAWMFANWAEYQYAILCEKASIEETELHLKRMDLANRNLLAAARTLAKVKRAKLPDVLAVVNVNTPTAQNVIVQG